MSTKHRPPQVFISHSWADNAWCAKFVTALEIGGVDVWWDVSGMHAGLLPIQIERELQARAIFVPVLSPHVYESNGQYRPWLKIEYSMAITLYNGQRDVRDIIPVIAETCNVPPIFNIFLGARGSGAITPERAAEEVLRLLGMKRSGDKHGTHITVPRSFVEAETLGRSLLVQGRADEALIVFETLQRRAQAWRSMEREGAAWAGIGRALGDLQRYDDALTAFLKAQESAPMNARGWAGSGTLLGRLGQMPQALADLEHATELQPDYQDAWLNKSTVLRHLGRNDEALAAAETGIALVPNYGPALAVKATVLSSLQRFDEELDTLEQALAVPETSTESMTTIPPQWRAVALANKANIFQRLGYYKTALGVYDQALTQDSKYAPAWHGRGLALWFLGDFNNALAAVERAIELLEGDPLERRIAEADGTKLADVWHTKGSTLFQLERYSEARAAFRKALSYHSVHQKALRGLGDVFRAESNFSEAYKLYRQAAEQDGNDTWACWNAAAAMLAHIGQVIDALALFDKAIEVSGATTSMPWRNKIEVLRQIGQTDKAAQVAEEMNRQIPRAVIEKDDRELRGTARS